MSGILKVNCCQVQENCDPTCDTHPICRGVECDGSDPLVIAEYLTIGRPAGNKMFDGKYWTAWHNGITSPSAATDINLKINAYKRTMTADGCGLFPSCTSPLSIPVVTADCAATALKAQTYCKKTYFTDNYYFQINGRVPFLGGSKDQTPCVDTSPTVAQGYPADGYSDPVQYCNLPPMPFPNELVDTTNSGININRPENTSRTAGWMCGENRCIAPRFGGMVTTTRSSTYPNLTYINNATCGTSIVTNRCTTATTSSSQKCCFDFLTIVPNHDTNFSAGDITRCGYSGAACECGLPTGASYPAYVDSPENGCSNAAWGIDVFDADLYNILSGFGLSTTVSCGTLSKVWVVLTTTNRVRFLFGLNGTAQDPASGAVFGWQDNVAKSRAETVSFAVPGQSLVLVVDLTITPQSWCKQNSRCPCVVSYSEQGLSQVTTSFFGGSGGSSQSVFGSGCSHTVNYGSYVLGLEEYDIPFCALSPPGCTPNCFNYPISPSFTWNPVVSSVRSDYVGNTPVERAHDGWKRYRNKFNHWRLVNTNLTNQALGEPGIGTDCCYTGKLIFGGAGWDEMYMPICTVMDPAWVATHGPCAGDNGDCINHLLFPQTTPAGCHHIQHNTNSSDFSIGLFPEGAQCFNCTNINNFYSCGPCFFIGACGTTLFDDCDCCNVQASVALPELMIVDYDYQNTCDPRGTWNLYQATSATKCNRSDWLNLGYAVVT